LDIYNIKGDKVISLVNSVFSSGTHNIFWDGKDGKGNILPSGVYLYRLKSGAFTEMKRLLYLK